MDIEDATLSVAVIGAGPRGISIVERLSANARLADARDVRICLFDPHQPGGGRIWSGDQPQHLLMNTLCADATHFTDASVTCEGPVVAGPTLYQWCGRIVRGELDAEESIRAEALDMQPWSHPSRKLLGRYLEWCHKRDLAELPEHVWLRFRQELVTDIERWHGGYRLQTDRGVEREYFDCVILASGHSDLVPGPREVEWSDFARKNGLFYGRSTNPLDQNLESILPGQKVILRGLGMNFFDYVSLLTKGRGGKFKEDDAGGLEYMASGREPIMVAGSRRGVPYRAKGIFGTMTPSFPRRYVSDEYLDQLESEGRQLDFMTDLWPRIAKDAALTYYRTLFAEEPQEFAATPERIQKELDTHAWGSPELEAALAAAVPNADARLDIDKLDRPLTGRKFANYQDFFAHWRDDLARDYQEASKGYGSALKSASVALGAGRGAVRRLAPYGGFRGQSYAGHIEGWYRGLGGTLASGPPARRILELIALLDAGLILPIGPDMRVEPTSDGFAASSPAIPGVSHECRGLLEAHLPATDLVRSANPLYRSLHRRGMARPYLIKDERVGDFTSGAIEVGPSPYPIIDADGNAQPGLFATGVPLESIHWGTQLGPLANTNSQFLRDTDAIAIAVLGHGQVTDAHHTAYQTASTGRG
jgi:hypothetical protein